MIKTRGVDNWYVCRYEGKENGQFCMRVEYDGPKEVVEGKDPNKTKNDNVAVPQVNTTMPAMQMGGGMQ